MQYYQQFTKIVKGTNIDDVFIDVPKEGKTLEMENLMKHIIEGVEVEKYEAEFYRILPLLDEKSRQSLERYTEVCELVEKIVNLLPGGTVSTKLLPKHNFAAIVMMSVCKSRGVNAKICRSQGVILKGY